MSFTALASRPGRAFWTLIAVSAAIRAVVAYVACCLVMALAWQITQHGAGALASGAAWAGLVLLTLSAIGGVRSMLRLRNGLRATRTVAGEVRTRRVRTPGAEVSAAARAAGLDELVRVVRSADRFAFTYGLLRPRVAVSSGLTASATPEELAAILAHEAEHVRGRDPLRGLIADAVTAHHFAFPLLGDLRAGFSAGREFAADRYAMRHCGTAAVAGALLKTATTPRWATALPVSGMGSAELLDARITQLETGSPPHPSVPARWRMATSAAGIAAYAWALPGAAALIAATPLACMP